MSTWVPATRETHGAPSERVRQRRSRGWGPEGERPGRFGLFFIGLWTLFLIQPLSTGWDRRGTVAGVVGMVATLAFAVAYMTVFARRRVQLRQGVVDFDVRRGVVALALPVLLALLMCVLLGETGTASAVYLCVLAVMLFPRWWGLPLALLVMAAFALAGLVVPGWHFDAGLLLTMAAATVAVWGVQQLIERNTELVASERQNRSLAVANERNRFARDLHDILGHSLTVITVKAELAGRLVDVDPARARAELADLERLSRDALSDVRRAVEGYRDLTLPGELARARLALDAARIEAALPGSTDEVPSEVRELFAWAVREGVTNVVRHSRATRCEVVLHPDRVEVRDDGVGPVAAGDFGGHGLLGLRERAAAAGATVVTRALEPGYSLAVVLA